VAKEPERVVMEICSIAGWIVDIATALGKGTEVANTSHDAWRWKNVKKKTDSVIQAPFFGSLYFHSRAPASDRRSTILSTY
jgi:hypothetical protein